MRRELPTAPHVRPTPTPQQGAPLLRIASATQATPVQTALSVRSTPTRMRRELPTAPHVRPTPTPQQGARLLRIASATQATPVQTALSVRSTPTRMRRELPAAPRATQALLRYRKGALRSTIAWAHVES